jgi:site-specific recombinase XerD
MSDFPVITDPAKQTLNERQLVMYRERRKNFIEWLEYVGKDPDHAEGYADATVEKTAYRTDAFMRWVWSQEDGFTLEVTPDHADAFMEELLYSEKSSSHKANTQKSIKRLFKWLAHERGGEEWEPNQSFSSNQGANQPRDFLTLNERQQIREAALEYGSIPAYNDLSPEERDRWKGHLAMRLQKPKDEVVPTDWEKANGWKVPSLVWTSLDAGLRPIEVGRASVHWVDVENSVLRIPAEESSKNEENWIVSLTNETATALERWLDEREQYAKYDETDTVWLTREANPYRTGSLRYLLGRLFEIAGIEAGNRQVSWYTLRHSTGTYMTREEDLAAAQAQLRHKSAETTMKYDNAPVEDRRDALERL